MLDRRDEHLWYVTGRVTAIFQKRTEAQKELVLPKAWKPANALSGFEPKLAQIQLQALSSTTVVPPTSQDTF